MVMTIRESIRFVLCAVLLALTVTLSHSYKVCTKSADCTGGCVCGLGTSSTPNNTAPNPQFCANSTAAAAIANGRSGGCDACAGNSVSAKCMQCEYTAQHGGCSDVQPAFCSSDDDCTGGEGCTCMMDKTSVPPMEGGVCMNKATYESGTKECKTCTQHSDCPGSLCTSNLLGRKVCNDCEVGPGIQAMGKCPASAAAGGLSDAASGTTKPAPCVATSWVRENSLMHAVLRHGRPARVICIDSASDSRLPCGTPGHLLRTRSGELISYLEACRSRGDVGCVHTTMPVSQLSHTYDWAQFESVDGELSLTSLSAHPTAARYGVSRSIAVLADVLNRAGLGCVTNAAAGVSFRLRVGGTDVSALLHGALS